MTFNFLEFCIDNTIEQAEEGHKHSRPGWIQVECPLCSGNPGFHLGYNLSADYLNCWRCGWHKKSEIVMAFTGCSEGQAKAFLKQYKGRPIARRTKESKDETLKTSKLSLPSGTGTIQKQHKRYLKTRKFNPEKLELLWNLSGTGPLGDYKLRIIAPIYFNQRMVSYQGRDITGRSRLKYKACSRSEEVRHHKRCLYGLEQTDNHSVVIVEGITDVWRLGPGAVATFGIGYTQEQVNLLKSFQNKFILFDSDDPQAIERAEKLGNSLSGFSGSTEIIQIHTQDPAEMKQKDADSIMSELIS